MDSDLASPTQGICGVEIEFVHEYLGDLTMSLVSPSGTTVDLIGPPTTLISPTNLSSWKINFVKCLAAASPDPGFTPTWSNLQPWQALTAYTGTYFPQSGCLEDFNSGSANGVWQIVIEDHDVFQLGSVANVTLLFCNPLGLECLPCTPNAGTLSPMAINICSGENIQSSQVTIDYGGNTPSPLLYTYEYLFISGNVILQSGTSFSITPPIGSYAICGLNYLTSDTSAVDALIAMSDYNQLLQAIDQGSICADLSSSCIALNVTGKPDTVIITGDLCNGEIFSFGGQDYFTDGIYFQTKDGPGLCDTTIEIRIYPRSLTVSVDAPDTLFCGAGDVVLQATPGGGVGPFTYQWTTLNGNITSPSNTASITVNQSGQYFVEISDGICSGTGSTNVVAGPNFPQVVFSGGTITCSRPVVNIKPIYSPSSASVLWNGPMGFTSNQPNIGVTVPGTYTLNITNAAGCTTKKSVNIDIDTATTPVVISIVDKKCDIMVATLGANFSSTEVLWDWTGPNAFSAKVWRPGISTPGLYNLTVTFNNGCQRSGAFLFDGDFSEPDIQVSPNDTLNCNEILTLSASSNTPGVSYLWQGPDGFSDPQAVVMTEEAGSYYAQVLAPNGCKNTDTVQVIQGNDIFTYQIINDTLTCLKTVVTIGVIAPEADVYDWINYTGPGDDQALIQVDKGGKYILEMTNSVTGCKTTAYITVKVDRVIPSFDYVLDTINCFDPVADLSFVPLPGFTYSSMYWELPDQTVVQGPVVSSPLDGDYKLVAIGINGCQRTTIVHVPIDTLSPFLILNADTLLCSDTIAIVAQSLDSVSTYQWDGAGIIEMEDFIIQVNQPGWYHLIATGPNGCPSPYDIFVDSNFTLPAYALLTDSLRCDKSAVLTAIPVGTNFSYSWYDPSSTLISSDSFVVVNQPGEYSLQMVGVNQCIAFDTVLLDSLEYPLVELFSDTFTCSRIAVDISSTVDVPSYTIAWLDFNEDTISQASGINVTSPGPFIASVTGQNACTTRDTIFAVHDTIPPKAIILLDGEIRCQFRDALLDGSGSNPQPLIFAWTTANGNILSNPTLSNINIQDTGLYVLSITQISNGCIGSDSLMVSEHPDAITDVSLIINSPECHGQGNASIMIDQISGGAGLVSFQLDSGALQSTPVFLGLNAGQYLLTLIDEKNCVFDTLIEIDTTIVFTVDAGPDIEIYLGEEADLSGVTDLPMVYFAMDEWIDYNGTICKDCPLLQVQPVETTSYTFQVSSNTGCVLADDVIVYVIEKAKYFIANVFSPNEDGVNDFVNLNSTGGIERVIQWTIYDRWGNAVFGATNFDPMDSSVFWNGRTSTGEFPNPGVFPYVIEFQLISGKREVHHGEITLLR